MDIQVLLKIANILQKENIRWGLGASSMLHFHGLVEKPRDIDLIVHEADALKAIELLKPLASFMQTDDGKGKYATKYFYEMIIDEQPIDVIGGYRILRQDWIYEFPPIGQGAIETVSFESNTLPLTCLEDWYMAYLIMNDPKQRIPLIEAYFENGIYVLKSERLKLAKEQILKKAPHEVDIINALNKWV